MGDIFEDAGDIMSDDDVAIIGRDDVSDEGDLMDPAIPASIEDDEGDDAQAAIPASIEHDGGEELA